MKIESIKRILVDHCIECHYQDHQLAALCDVVRADGSFSGEWKLFDESDSLEDVRIWLGY